MELLVVAVFLAFLALILVVKTAVIVPQKEQYVVERLGKYRATLDAGFHLLIPFLDRVAYRRSLKEEVLDIPSQRCVTRDNVSVEIDGVLYMQVVDARQSSYGIENYRFASIQLAQTSLRSAIGKIVLDKSFEERETLNQQVVAALDEAAQSWGIKALRYEIKDIVPPQTVMDAMEKQMRAEREKRAAILESEGMKQSAINISEGEKQREINESEGERQRLINESQGRAQAIEVVAEATAKGLNTVAAALDAPGGQSAANLRLAEQYIGEFGKLAKEGTTMIVPTDVADVGGFVAALSKLVQQGKDAR